MTEQVSFDAAERRARYLGFDAGAAAASWVLMSEADATSVVEDVDPAVLDQWAQPDLSGQWADGQTPRGLVEEVGGNDGDVAFFGGDLVDPLCDAWERGVSEAWTLALEGIALRTLGRVEDALRVERMVEHYADVLRVLADLDAADGVAAVDLDDDTAVWRVEADDRVSVQLDPVLDHWHTSETSGNGTDRVRVTQRPFRTLAEAVEHAVERVRARS